MAASSLHRPSLDSLLSLTHPKIQGPIPRTNPPRTLSASRQSRSVTFQLVLKQAEWQTPSLAESEPIQSWPVHLSDWRGAVSAALAAKALLRDTSLEGESREQKRWV